jgi:phosphopantothenoylcysteine decarboxylase/phosphopantothenate--cysteine ligase
MGFAIAEELSKMGADVKLISGPTHLSLNDRGVERTDVNSAEEMLIACMNDFEKMDIIVMSAAVADFRPGEESTEKIKKKNNLLNVSLIPTTDILKSMGEKKRKNQFLVGFALETNNELVNAREKLVNKNLDLIVLNSLNDAGAGFDVSTNKVTFIEKSGRENSFGIKLKTEVARDLVDLIMNSYKK